jgi:hypothetical protein
MVDEWKMVSLGRAFYDFLWAADSVSLQPGLLRLSHWTIDFHQDSHKQTHASLWIRLVAPNFFSSSNFSSALNNVANSIPQGALPRPTIPVLDLVTVDEHDDENIAEEEGMKNTVSKEPVLSSPSVLNVEHSTVNDDNVSRTQVIPSNFPSIDAPAATALVDTDTQLAIA